MGLGTTLDLTLTGMAYGGDAFGKDEQGRVVFVPFALPGERVRVTLTEHRRGWARGRLTSILEPASQRVDPACKHYAQCGGCHYQHMTLEYQTSLKADIVRDQLTRLGHFTAPPVLATIPSPTPNQTRNHIQFGLTASGRLGFRAAGSHRIIPVDECHLPEPSISAVWPRLRLAHIPRLRRVSVRTDTRQCTQVSLEAEGPPPRDLKLDGPFSAMWHAGGVATCLQGADKLEFDVMGYPFPVSSLSFFQVHNGLVDSLICHALQAMAVVPGEVLFDLYAGVGLFSAFLAKAGARVVAVELSPHACADYRAHLEGARSVVLHQGAVEDVLPSIPDRPQGVLVDPPRSGLAPSVVQDLIARRPSRIVYVSCDPSTLARDGQRLVAGGYRLEQALPIDMFPQTFHIETLSLWRR